MEHTYIQKQRYLKYSAHTYEVPTIRKALHLKLGSISDRAGPSLIKFPFLPPVQVTFRLVKKCTNSLGLPHKSPEGLTVLPSHSWLIEPRPWSSYPYLDHKGTLAPGHDLRQWQLCKAQCQRAELWDLTDLDSSLSSITSRLCDLGLAVSSLWTLMSSSTNRREQPFSEGC